MLRVKKFTKKLFKLDEDVYNEIEKLLKEKIKNENKYLKFIEPIDLNSSSKMEKIGYNDDKNIVVFLNIKNNDTSYVVNLDDFNIYYKIYILLVLENYNFEQ